MRLPRGMLILCALALTGAAPSTRLEEEVRTAQASPTSGTPTSGVQAYSFPTGAGLLFF